MNNRTQQLFDRSIREALKVKHKAKARAVPVDPQQFSEPKREDRRGWKLHLDPQTGATVWGPV